MKTSKYFGDKNFYKMVFAIAVPIMVQNGITNFVSLLDNIMVGQIGTDPMSGVAIVNQLLFVFYLCIFGAISGAGIFGAQYAGKENHQGLKETLRFKLIICTVISALGMLFFILFSTQLIGLFLHEGSVTGDISATLNYGKEYLFIMTMGLVPFGITQSYASTLREKGETILPMKAGVAAVFVNLILNYLFIFGKFGFPELGVNGAAAATVVSRFVECFIVVAWTHSHKEINKFACGLYKKFHVSANLIKQIIIKGSPLMLNEVLWAAGMTTLIQCYSNKGLAVVGGLNIASTISNLFSVVYISLGSAISIIIGQLLGAAKMKEAKDTDTKLIVFSVVMCAILGVFLMVIAPAFPLLYNTTDEVKTLATDFIIILGLNMPIQAFMNATYFTMRSGGKTVITFLFDSVFVWAVNIPCAFILVNYTNMNIVLIYLICQLVDIIKCVIGYTLVKKDAWINNLTI
ncbi:putative efflux protein, MATE family [Hathewaya proteolytica DSM 3090]|uniref:Probable multidrug resistance protein NorM n=1 Tax=Hathewaya proteolytica DSM 3090 TaxID=1121331 RepID=A0A1M6NYD7_9CLOT|nr:MATE family efflux transporter [Hathewaya proteolytica]SHK00660.1 putative efflux protein, MATE family [Hathewaya proteolytica DSM 3090]